MNPLGCTKCARRMLMALAAVASALLITGCGSSSVQKPNNNGFNNGSLSGTYVISIAGLDINSQQQTESFFAIVGAITADGKGGLTGAIDINDPNIMSGNGVYLNQSLSNGSGYGVSADGRGSGTIVTPVGTFGIDFVLTSTGHGLITRFDGSGSGSGTMDLQGTASQSSLTSLAFSLAGGVSSKNGNLVGTVGAFTLNSSGTATGTQDFNNNGSSTGSVSGPAALTAGSALVLTSGTNGTAQLNSSIGALAFDVWVIDSTHLKFIETDTTSGLTLSGDAFTQQTSFTAGQVVFTVGGLDSSKAPFAAGGFATSDTNFTLSNGTEDYNDAGTTGMQTSVGGSCTSFVSGRCQLAVTGFSNGISQPTFEFAAYPSSGGVLLLENDSLGLAQGAAFVQSATSFAASAGYGLNLSGENTAQFGEVDDIAQFNAGSPATSFTGNANMTGQLDENDLAFQLYPGSALSGIYVPDSPATGRGSISIPSINTFNTTLNLQYYVVDASDILLLDVDSSTNGAPQVAVGTFELQNSPSAGAGAAARPHITIVRPVTRLHGSLRRK